MAGRGGEDGGGVTALQTVFKISCGSTLRNSNETSGHYFVRDVRTINSRLKKKGIFNNLMNKDFVPNLNYTKSTALSHNIENLGSALCSHISRTFSKLGFVFLHCPSI